MDTGDNLALSAHGWTRQHGTIYHEICRIAENAGSDLIVMASHRPEVKDYLLGPNAARVVRHAKQSVFIVRGVSQSSSPAVNE